MAIVILIGGKYRHKILKKQIFSLFFLHFFYDYFSFISFRSMKISTTLLGITFLMLLASCEKEIASDNKETPETPTPPTVIDERQKDNALTVAQAIAEEEGSIIYVKGYLVASTQKSIKYMDFDEPFSGSSAIIIADQTAENYTEFNEEEMMPVCLTDCSKSIREALNLEAHPENHNHLIYIYGIRQTYMYKAGLKNLGSYEIK